MKFQITMKDPDGVDESLQDEFMRFPPTDLTAEQEEERDAAAEVRFDRANEFLKGWLQYREYVTLEFDTEAGTCVVKKL